MHLKNVYIYDSLATHLTLEDDFGVGHELNYGGKLLTVEYHYTQLIRICEGVVFWRCPLSCRPQGPVRVASCLVAVAASVGYRSLGQSLSRQTMIIWRSALQLHSILFKNIFGEKVDSGTR